MGENDNGPSPEELEEALEKVDDDRYEGRDDMEEPVKHLDDTDEMIEDAQENLGN